MVEKRRHRNMMLFRIISMTARMRVTADLENLVPHFPQHQFMQASRRSDEFSCLQGHLLSNGVLCFSICSFPRTPRYRFRVPGIHTHIPSSVGALRLRCNGALRIYISTQLGQIPATAVFAAGSSWLTVTGQSMLLRSGWHWRILWPLAARLLPPSSLLSDTVRCLCFGCLAERVINVYWCCRPLSLGWKRRPMNGDGISVDCSGLHWLGGPSIPFF